VSDICHATILSSVQLRSLRQRLGLAITHHRDRRPIPVEVRPHVGASPAVGSVSNAEGVPHLRQHLERFIGVLTVIELMVKRGENTDANSCDGNASNHADL
jgi:hypothetical protein